MKTLQLGELFAMPLQSAIRAQSLAFQETISFIEQFGLEDGVAKTFKFKAERMVEETTVNPKTGASETQFKVEPYEVSIPLLALISPPNVQLQEMNVEFGVEIVEAESESIKSSSIPSSVLGSSLASSRSVFTSLSESNPTTMKVNMKIVSQVPEGMARLNDLLTDLLSGQSTETKEGTSPSVEKIPDISKAATDILKGKKILTAKDFVSATETTESVKNLAKTLDVPEDRIAEWREKAKGLIKEK